MDPLRDGPLRYLGYANELGESFRPVAPRLVVPSYLVSFGYVFADTLDKAAKEHAQACVRARAAFWARLRAREPVPSSQYGC